MYNLLNFNPPISYTRRFGPVPNGVQKAADVPIATHIASACGLIPQASPIMIDIGVKIAQREVPIMKFVPTTEIKVTKATTMIGCMLDIYPDMESTRYWAAPVEDIALLNVKIPATRKKGVDTEGLFTASLAPMHPVITTRKAPSAAATCIAKLCCHAVNDE